MSGSNRSVRPNLPEPPILASRGLWWHPKELLALLLHSEKGRFLIAGGVNTVFAYVSFAFLYHVLSRVMHYAVIVVISNVICITFSFLTHKFYAFRSHENWLRAYLRYYVVYAIPFVLGLGGFAFCIEVLHLNAYVTQALIMAVSTVITFVGHKYFSFRNQSRTPTAS